MALELKERGDLQAIFPILVGEISHNDDQGLGDLLGDFFTGGGKPACKVMS